MTDIILYITHGCPKCKILKQWLRNNGHKFIVKDLENLDIMADLVMRNAVVQTAPALEVNGVVHLNSEFFDVNNQLNGTLIKIMEEK